MPVQRTAPHRGNSTSKDNDDLGGQRFLPKSHAYKLLKQKQAVHDSDIEGGEKHHKHNKARECKPVYQPEEALDVHTSWVCWSCTLGSGVLLLLLAVSGFIFLGYPNAGWYWQTEVLEKVQDFVWWQANMTETVTTTVMFRNVMIANRRAVFTTVTNTIVANIVVVVTNTTSVTMPFTSTTLTTPTSSTTSTTLTSSTVSRTSITTTTSVTLTASTTPTVSTTSTASTTTTTPAMVGEYGAVTVFSLKESEARLRVRRMFEVFQIREFQFYDAMQGYSHPPAPDLEEWQTACLNRTVQKKVIRAYVDEVRRLGGRSWLYVQSMATDMGDTAWQEGFHVLGQHFCYNRPVMDRIMLSAAWGQHIAPQWANFTADLGFDGIHWDTLGADGNLPAFLHAAQPLLQARGLRQTCNFVDGAGWQDSLLTTGVITFPYWEVWNVPLVEDIFYHKLRLWKSGTLACYPGENPLHIGEPQNKEERGKFPLDIIVKRWQKARLHGARYLVISDGLSHIQTAYLPNTIGISWQDIRKLRSAAFGEPAVVLEGCACNCSWASVAGACARDGGSCCVPVCCTTGFNSGDRNASSDAAGLAIVAD